MPPEVLTIEALEVFEEDRFRRAGIELYDLAFGFLRRTGVQFRILPQGMGLSRVVNHLIWQADHHLEFLDGKIIHPDQVIHVATHCLLDRLWPEAGPERLLLAETLASATDLYLLGKLMRAGEEATFLEDTLGSFDYYFELYGSTSPPLEELLQTIHDAPFRAMMDLSDYLFRFCLPFLRGTIDEQTLTRSVEKNQPFYPLIHHYHVTNWILNLRARFPDPPRQNHPPDLWEDEAAMLAAFAPRP